MSECRGWHRPIPVDDLTTEQVDAGVVHGVKGKPIWCDRHTWDIRDNLLAVPELYVQLHVEARHATPKPAGGKVSGSRHEPSPSPRIDDADELARWACDWEDTIRHHLAHPAAPVAASGRPRALTEATGYLTRHLAQALALDDDTDEPTGYMLGVDINTTHRRLLRRCRADRLVHDLDPPCPACDHRTLRRDDGDDHVRCSNRDCQETWTEVEYQRLVLILASDVG